MRLLAKRCSRRSNPTPKRSPGHDAPGAQARAHHRCRLGIGRAIAQRFVAEGARIALIDLDAQQDPAAARAGVTALHPLGRLGDPRDIADAFVYLASDEAGWVTGTTVPVDGGLTAGIAPR